MRTFVNTGSYMKKALQYFGWPALVGLLLALALIGWFPHWVGLNPSSSHSQFQDMPRRAAAGSYAPAVAQAAPAVVNLYTTRMVSEPIDPLYNDPAVQRFLGNNLPQQSRLESSLGSAVIMTTEGYLLTNHHVIEGAEQIIVALRDGRETLAELIGIDPETDLAVLKIDLPDLPVIRRGRAEQVQIGDVVLAIGNPFGVGQTVTMGIVSATGRNQLGINTYEDFIQTDAAINPGNSGGALIDAGGRLLGINTAIFSRSGGSQGIGFAIPVALASSVMDSIIQQGHVVRGWLGLEVQLLTAELAEAFALQDRPGILVAGVLRDGPAEQAGLRPGDIILSIAGMAADDWRSSMNQVARMQPGERIEMDILREGAELRLSVEVGLRPLLERAHD